MIAQIFVYGESLESFIVSIIVPDQENVLKWAKHKGMGNSSYDEILQNKDLKAAISKEIEDMAKEYKLNSLEKVKKF